MTKIEWATKTWNPTVGCTRVSPGCEHCYAERMAYRLDRMGKDDYFGVTKAGKPPRWSGLVRTIPDRLDEPLRWRKPQRIFVDSMSDLFHEKVPDAFLDRVFAAMALGGMMTSRRLFAHTFLVLTKRPERMRDYLSDPTACERIACQMPTFGTVNGKPMPPAKSMPEHLRPKWPLPNVHLGVSCEDQERADERIPLLLQTPAAVRWVSAEPLLGPLDLGSACNAICVHEEDGYMEPDTGAWICRRCEEAELDLDWVVVGGESGPRARPCYVEHVRDVVRQCQEARVPVFVKQLGAHPVETRPTPCEKWPDSETEYGLKLRDPKGGDPLEWPEDLRVREVPA